MAPIVVPHHHHEEKVCIENTHCPTEKDAHQQDIPEHDHEHDGENSLEYCSLKQVVVLPSNQVIQILKITKSKNNFTSFTDLQTAFIETFVNAYDTNFVSTLQLTLLTSIYGLRAPPTV